MSSRSMSAGYLSAGHQREADHQRRNHQRGDERVRSRHRKWQASVERVHARADQAHHEQEHDQHQVVFEAAVLVPQTLRGVDLDRGGAPRLPVHLAHIPFLLRELRWSFEDLSHELPPDRSVSERTVHATEFPRSSVAAYVILNTHCTSVTRTSK